ncbi:PAS domain-containing protein [bacterium]|nr:MAG: PAS domain-containing protein [bacterium]
MSGGKDGLQEPVVSWRKDRSGIYQEVSPDFCRFFRLKEGVDPVGKHDCVLFPSGVADRFGAEDARVLRQGSPVIVEQEYEGHWVELARLPLLGGVSDVIGTYGFGRDLGHRSICSDRAHPAERNFQSFLDNSPKIVLRFDRKKRLIYRNPAAEAFSGQSLSQEMGLPVEEHGVLPRDEALELSAGIGRVISSGIPLEMEFCWDYRGEQRQFQLRVAPEFDAEGRINGAIVIASDNSVVRQARLRLRKSRELLSALAIHHQHEHEAERRSIAQRIHEDLAQQLVALRMHSAFLSRQYEIPSLTEQLAQVSAIADACIAKARDMVTTLRPTVLDLGIVPALEWLAEDFHRGLGMQIELQLDETLMVGDCTTTFLFRAAQEALINTVLHAAASRVVIQLFRSSSDGMVCLCVHDNGCGFSGDLQLPEDSFGLLGISEQARHLGGHFSIYSQPMQGCTLEVLVPFA